LLVKEHKKFIKLKNAYALEVEKCENLSPFALDVEMLTLML
jgi:hypothetical protein